MLHVHNISKHYPGAERPAVDNVSLDIHSGEFLSLLGRSGSGKSTLLSMLASLVLPDSGRIVFEGRDICEFGEQARNRLRRESFAVVFQLHHLIPYLTALENVLLPCVSGFSGIRAADRETAAAMLRRVGLSGKEDAMPGKLSGGEQQRVAIARALTRGSRILFADEPTGSLDSVTGASIMKLLRELNEEGLTIVMVTHNPEYARLSGRAITMEDGRIAA